MQAKMAAVQAALETTMVEASAGGGVVTAVVTGGQKVVSVTISPDVVGDRRDAPRPDRRSRQRKPSTVARAGGGEDAVGDRRPGPAARAALGPGPGSVVRDGAAGAARAADLGALTAPGVGPKTAQRLAFHLLRADRERVERLAEVLVELKSRLVTAALLQHRRGAALRGLRVGAPGLDRDLRRRGALDVLAVERTGEYRGLFHVLHGVLSPIDNIGAEDIHIPELLSAPRGREVVEVIVATNSDIEGEATAAYLHRLIAPSG